MIEPPEIQSMVHWMTKVNFCLDIIYCFNSALLVITFLNVDQLVDIP